MIRRQGIGLALAIILSGAVARATEDPPVEWVDPKTGHRVVRLSKEPGSASLYFHQYPYSANGKKLVFSAPSGIWTVDLETRELEQVVKGRAGVLLTGRKTGDVYYVRPKRRPGDDDRDREERARDDEFRPQGDTQRRPDTASRADDR